MHPRPHCFGVPSLAFMLLWLGPFASALRSAEPTAAVEQWDAFELTLSGPSDGNPFTDVTLSARFSQGDRSITAAGFYDGDGIYKIRFMPDAVGEWRYETTANQPELTGKAGAFAAIPPSKGNHGPVRLRNTFHFAYADGTPFFPLGTTSYSWTHRSDVRQEQTLRTLAAAPFNKLRFCVFPVGSSRHSGEPRFPFEGTPPDRWDFARFKPEYFRNLEQRVRQLRDLGIEADVILFHPYDRGHWGFDRMEAEADDRYLRYVVARLSAYRNVWWSLANEFDFMEKKTEADWDRFFHIVQTSDPHDHLRSIHHARLIYNNTQPWVTHASIQNGAAALDPERAVLYRDVYRKPVVFDEVKYEGDIEARWGRLSGEEMVFRFWNGLVAGSYVGHGESFRDPPDPWLSGGGELRGRSVARLAFLKRIMETGPAAGMEPIDKWQERRTGGQPGEYYLVYLGTDTRSSWPFELYKTGLADGMKFDVEVIDTWKMTITPVDGAFELKQRDNYVFADKDGRAVPLPGRPYQAIRIRRLP